MSLARACLSAGRRSAGWVAWDTLTSPRPAVVLMVAGRQQRCPGQQVGEPIQAGYLVVEVGEQGDVVAVGLAFRLLPLPAEGVLPGAQLAGQAPAAVFGDDGAVDLLAAAVVPAPVPAHQRLPMRRYSDQIHFRIIVILLCPRPFPQSRQRSWMSFRLPSLPVRVTHSSRPPRRGHDRRAALALIILEKS